MRRLCAASVLLSLSLALAGCMSIPLATMWQLRSFDAQDLAAVDPAEVRVAALVEPDVGPIDPARSHLKVTLTPHDGPPEVHAFGLRPARVVGGPLVPAGDSRWQVFVLDDDGLAAMRKLKPRLADLEEDYRKWALSVSVQGLEDMTVAVDALYFSVRVQLDDDQAPLVLFDRARIEVESNG